MGYPFEIDVSVDCCMRMSLLVVTTNEAAPDVDAPYKDGTPGMTIVLNNNSPDHLLVISPLSSIGPVLC